VQHVVQESRRFETTIKHLDSLKKATEISVTFYDLILKLVLRNWRRLAQMSFFHRYPPTTIADKFHGRQFILTYMLRIDRGGPAEAAF
jgi:hypothetical protein